MGLYTERKIQILRKKLNNIVLRIYFVLYHNKFITTEYLEKIYHF